MGSEGASPNGGAACAVCGCGAAVYCPADAAALCGACDAAVHAANPLASRHERVSLASAAAAAAMAGVCNLFAGDDVESSNSSGQDSGEQSLFELLSDVDAYVDFVGRHHLLDDAAQAAAWLSPGIAASQSVPWSPEAVLVPGLPAAAPPALSSTERAARVRRYREKRKARKFQKTIRYASRKAYAEARPRIKGRFVKRAAAAATDAEADKLWLSFADCGAHHDGGLCTETAYGVVPSF